MIEINQPESAFPSTFKSLHPKEQQVHRWGMTLRDYFAAKAMQGLITSRHTDYENGWYDEDMLAKSAYEMADAMLKAREA